MTSTRFIKIIFGVLAIIYFYNCALTTDSWHFIDGVNLLIHEAGHWIFWPFGEFMHVLGGSLNQVLIPLLFVVYFWFKEDLYSAGICLLWMGQSLVNASVYAGDSVVMKLELLTGGNGWETDGHDWNWLLIRTGLLHHTTQVALIIRTAGWLALIGGAVWIIYSMYKNNKSNSTYEKI